MGFSLRRPFPPPQLAPLVRPLTPEEVKKGKQTPSNVGYWTEASLAALQRWIRDLFHAYEGGLPPGQFTGVPTQVRAGVDGETGLPEMGWSTGLHRHAILTLPAAVLTPISISIEGVSPALARADHTHDMSRVMADVMTKVSLGF